LDQPRSRRLAAGAESTLWGDQGAKEIRSLVKLRSLMTAVVTTVLTLILILLAGAALDQLRDSGLMFVCLSAAASAVYILGGIYMWYKVWPRRQAPER